MCTDVESIQTHCNCSLTFKVVVTTVYSALVFLFISFIVSKNRYICKTVFDNVVKKISALNNMNNLNKLKFTTNRLVVLKRELEEKQSELIFFEVMSNPNLNPSPNLKL